MKNLLLTTALILAFAFCTKKNPPANNQKILEKFLGTWVSIDSAGIWKDSITVIKRDTLIFSLDKIDDPRIIEFKPSLKRIGLSEVFYEWHLDGLIQNKLKITYRGPWSFLPNTTFQNKINLSMDTLHIAGFNEVYPKGAFNKYYKIKL